MKLLSIKLTSLLLVAFVAFAGCKKEDKEDDPIELDQNMSLTFNLTVDGQPYTLGSMTSISTAGTANFNLFLFYLSHIELLSAEGGEAVKLSEVVFGEMEEGDQSYTFNFKAPEGSYSAVKMGFGLDPDQNNTDPNEVALDHPLSSSKGMYWVWATKYRFLIVEGRAHPDANNNLAGSDITLLSYHPGADALLRQKIFTRSIPVSKFEKTQLQFEIDLAKIFDGPGGEIDILVENQTHTAPSDYHIAEKFMDNLPAAVTLK